MIRKFHPDKVPILLNRVKQSKLKEFDNNKYLPHDAGSSSSRASQSSSSSWSSRRNCSSTTPKPSTSSPTTHCFTPNRPSKMYTRNMPRRISFCTSATASIPPSDTHNDHHASAFPIRHRINQYFSLPRPDPSESPGARMYLLYTRFPFSIVYSVTSLEPSCFVIVVFFVVTVLPLLSK